MTLRPNYFLAFGKTFALTFVFIVFAVGVIPYFQGKGFHFSNVLEMGTVMGTVFGIVVSVIFTPKEITWNDDTIRIRAIFPGTGEFSWRQLEAWNPYGRGTFMIKFEGKQAYQIAPAGFRSKDWKNFRALLDRRFPEKKTWFSVGGRPVR